MRLAVSRDQCITPVQVFSVSLGRAAVFMDPASPVVEFEGDGGEVGEVGLVESAQFSALG
jgi:hypothetical protein